MMKKIFFNNNFRNRRFARYALTVVAGLALLFLGNNISHVYKDRFSMKFIRKVKRLKWR